MQHPATGTIFVSWHPEFCIPPAVFRIVISLHRRAKPPARHCTSFRLDRPALSRPPYLPYRANLRLPFVNNLSSQAPSAPATTFQEPQTNKQKNIPKEFSKSPNKASKKSPKEPPLHAKENLFSSFPKQKRSQPRVSGAGQAP